MTFFTRLSRIAACLALAGAGAAQAGAPFAHDAAPAYFRLQLGAFEITALNDGTVDLPVDTLLHQAPEKTRAALAAAFLNSPLETSTNAFLVNTGTKLILIDTGAGGLFVPTLGKLAANLAASGYQAAQVDDIYLTHLHPDHVGGLMANGARLFPNAVLHADRRDVDFWLGAANRDKAPAAAKVFFDAAMTSLQPYIEAGKLRPFDHDGELMPGLTALATYGHTAGHTSYLIASEGKTLLVGGDLINVAPVQLKDTAIASDFDGDGPAAAAERRKVLAQAARDGLLVAAAHMPFPGIGHVLGDGGGFAWAPVNYTRMK